MIARICLITLLAIAFSSSVFAKKEFMNHTRLMDHGDGHLMDMDGGMIMGQNKDILPGGCDAISEIREITVHAGHKYAKEFPGRMFAFDTQEYQFKPCTQLTVNFINDDNIRHQWMMHGLPKYLYPKGMFHLEITGPGKISGTLIFPSNDKTYLVHCDISQHMEKGMKGQVKIGKGSGDLPSIPGVTANVIQDDYSDSIPQTTSTITKNAVSSSLSAEMTNQSIVSAMTIIGLVLGLLLTSYMARKLKGIPANKIINIIFKSIALKLTCLTKLILNMLRIKKSVESPTK